jgi:hypothetical protein
MRAITTFNLRIASAAIFLGIFVGAIGFVRTGALLIATGTAVVVLARSGQVKGRRRIIESYLPFAIAGILFTLALALPKGL